MMTTLVWIGGIALGAVVSFVLGYLLRANFWRRWPSKTSPT